MEITSKRTTISGDTVAGDFAAEAEAVIIGRIVARLKCLCKGEGR